MTSPTNRERAIRAENALYGLCAAAGCNLDEALTDLLADLMHWTAVTGRDFEHTLDTARIHFDAEVQP
ncbi:MAG: hypothetical protein AB7J30_00420 [Hyphomicrobium sp.]|uniref:hypothetical protein n=1 Tax=Hyphomicrobium sp. TaxID=82 RepID=UPI003D0B1FDE